MQDALGALGGKAVIKKTPSTEKPDKPKKKKRTSQRRPGRSGLPQRKEELYLAQAVSLKTDNMDFPPASIQTPSYNLLGQIRSRYILDGKGSKLSDSQKNSIRDLIIRSMGFETRPSQDDAITVGPLKDHHRRMAEEPTHMAQGTKPGLLSPLLDYILEKPEARFNTATSIALKETRAVLLARNSGS